MSMRRNVWLVVTAKSLGTSDVSGVTAESGRDKKIRHRRDPVTKCESQRDLGLACEANERKSEKAYGCLMTGADGRGGGRLRGTGDIGFGVTSHRLTEVGELVYKPMLTP